MHDRNTTDVLQGDLKDNGNVRWLYDRFREELQDYVTQRISEGYQHRVDAELIAETSFRQALEYADKNRKNRANSEAFKALLLHIAGREVCSQITFHSAQKRDANREVPDGGAVGHVFVDQQPLTPDQQASLREATRRWLAVLVQEKDQINSMINVLGVALELNASEIIEVLKGMPSIGRIPSPPTIRAQIDRGFSKLNRILGSDDQAAANDDSGT